MASDSQVQSELYSSVKRKMWVLLAPCELLEYRQDLRVEVTYNAETGIVIAIYILHGFS